MKKLLKRVPIDNKVRLKNNYLFYKALNNVLYTANGCILLQNRGDEIQQWEQQWTDSDWQRVFEIHKDRIGYEWCYNDLHLCDFFQKDFIVIKRK